MPRPTQHALARRALIDQPSTPASSARHRPPRFAHRSAAVVAISVLGVGAAGSVMLTGHAEQVASAPQATAPTAQISIDATVPVPAAFVRSSVLRRPAADAGRARTADRAREADLAKTSAVVTKQSKKLIARQQAEQDAAGTPTLPVTSGYTVAARFGAVGSWSRYHTGFDFAAPIGTPVHAPTAGVVTTAGSGPASGWAGTYVTIRHDDGTQTLYAHLSATTVQVGDHVRGGDVVGKIGVTGRSFGPHLHFEVYPAGIEPGDIYRAIDPVPWLDALGLKP